MISQATTRRQVLRMSTSAGRGIFAVTSVVAVTGLMLVGAAQSSTAQSPVPASSFGNSLGLDEQQSAELQVQINQTLAATSGGSQVSQYEIAWDGGAVQMAFPAPGTEVPPPSSVAALALPNAAKAVKPDPDTGEIGAVNDCVGGWYCFWDHADYEGRRLQWSYRYCNNEFPNKAPYINFTDYDFNDRTSSWRNKSIQSAAPAYVYVYDHVNAGGTLLWTEDTSGRSNYVGDQDNDRASSFKACERSP